MFAFGYPPDVPTWNIIAESLPLFLIYSCTFTRRLQHHDPKGLRPYPHNPAMTDDLRPKVVQLAGHSAKIQG